MHTVCQLTRIRARASTLLLVTTDASLLLALLMKFSQRVGSGLLAAVLLL